MNTDKKNIMPLVNPVIVFREEFDDWAILFDSDTAKTYGLDPVSVFIWKQIDGKHTQQDILSALKEKCDGGIPEDASQHLDEFIKDLENNGLIGYEK